MRSSLYLLALFISFSIMSTPIHSYAQDKQTSKQVSNKESTAPKEKKSLYGRASDAQMKEAKNYYRICTTTASMNTLKDCKCAAAEYLEARLELGNSASVDDIIKKNLNTCLRNKEQLSLPEGKFDYSKVPQIYIEEALEIYSYCNEKPSLNINYDCQCYAAEFLSKRIDEGKRVSQNEIMISLRGTCKNVVGTTGAYYKSCLSNEFDTSDLGDDVTQKDYCECVARHWAKSYRNYTGNIDSIFAHRELIFAANLQCRRPEMYVDLDKSN